MADQQVASALDASAPGSAVDFTPELQVTIARIRDEVTAQFGELVRLGLTGGHHGNLSARVPGAELFVITPDAVAVPELRPENTILFDLTGAVIPDTPGAESRPSSDAAAHAHVYRNLSHVGAVAHTHSTYATAWAARGEAIPCVLTAIADGFGGDIPIGPFATIGDESIGAGIVATLRDHRSRAVLMRNHGPFTIGSDARDAVRAAELVEDVARTVQIARQLGELDRVPADAIDGLFMRYHQFDQHSSGVRS